MFFTFGSIPKVKANECNKSIDVASQILKVWALTYRVIIVLSNSPPLAKVWIGYVVATPVDRWRPARKIVTRWSQKVTTSQHSSPLRLISQGMQFLHDINSLPGMSLKALVWTRWTGRTPIEKYFRRKKAVYFEIHQAALFYRDKSTRRRFFTERCHWSKFLFRNCKTYLNEKQKILQQLFVLIHSCLQGVPCSY